MIYFRYCRNFTTIRLLLPNILKSKQGGVFPLSMNKNEIAQNMKEMNRYLNLTITWKCLILYGLRSRFCTCYTKLLFLYSFTPNMVDILHLFFRIGDSLHIFIFGHKIFSTWGRESNNLAGTYTCVLTDSAIAFWNFMRILQYTDAN